MTTLIGSSLGKYSITALLGSGGMAEVYRAHHPTLDRPVAIKVMLGHLASQPDFLAIFEREARAVARLRHPHIVQVYDFDVADALHYMVMEFVDGPTLAAQLTARACPLPLPEVAAFFPELVSAVGYAHARGVIHRDLKPANVMFTPEGQVVLTDFGIAQLATAAPITQSGHIVGTPAYMSPEQAQGLPVDGRSDIYGLGIMLYEIVTGKRPFTGPTPQVILQHIREPLSLPTTIVSDLPPAVEQVILRATSKQPDDRYQTAEEMVHALRNVPGGPTFAAFQPAATVVADAAPATIRLELPPCPYRGLFAFREEDAPLFFGRDTVIDALVTAVEQQPAVAVIGPSGSGKSSVVAAGLLPTLKQAANLREAQGSAWSITAMRPGSRPFHALARALLALLEPETSTTDRLIETGKLAQALDSGTVTVAEVAAQIAQQHPHAPRLLLVLDQFEELYTLCPDTALRQRFLDGLLAALVPAPTLTLVLTLRADFVGQAVSYRPVADLLHTSSFILGPMNRAELEQAIVNPAQKYGVPFESGLIERILNEVGSEPGNLPLLEFALVLLWEHHQSGLLTHAGYEAIGCVEGALAGYADQVYEGLAAAEQEAARRIFIQLVQPGEGTEDTRRVAGAAEILSGDWDLVRRLADARLVVTGRDTAGETVEVVHEALIRGWERLRGWMQDDRAFRGWQERLRGALRQWERNSKDEGALLRGAPLAEAEGWLAERGAEVSEHERAYIEASAALRRRTRQRVVGGTIAAMVVLLVLLAFTGWQWWRANQQQQAAEAEAERARAAEAEAEQQSLVALSRQLAAQSVSLQQRDVNLSLLLAAQADAVTSTVESRGALLDGLRVSPHLSTTLRGHKNTVWSVAFSPDGQTLASGSDDTTIMLWNLATGQPLGPPLRGHEASINSIAFSPDGQTLASGSDDTTIMLWNLATQQQIGLPLRGHEDAIRSIAFSPDGQTLASGSQDTTIRLWDVATGQQIGEPLRGHSDFVWSIAFSPDGQMLASGSEDKTIRLWDGATGQQLDSPLRGHKDWVYSVAFSPDGHTLASGSYDNTIILWDMATRQPIGPPLRGHEDQVWSVAFSPDGQILASGSRDTTIRLWEVATKQQTGSSLRGHEDEVYSVAFSSDGHTLASGGWEPDVRLWDLTTTPPTSTTLRGHRESVWSVAFSPDGQILASGSRDTTVRLWNVATGQQIGNPLHGHTGGVPRVAFSPDGQTLASAGADRIICLWDLTATPPTSTTLHSHEKAVNSVAFSPDGQILVSGSDDSTIRIWDVASGQHIGEPLRGHTGPVRNVVFSPNGQMLASGSWDYTIRIWDVATGQQIGNPLRGHTDWVWSVAFSPDGQTIASGSLDNTFILWDVATRQPHINPLHGHESGITSVAFSPDGKLLISGSRDSTIRFWDVSSVTSWKQRACYKVNHNLSLDEWHRYLGDRPYEKTCPDLPVGEGVE